MAEIKFSTGNSNMNMDNKKIGKMTLILVIAIAALVIIFNCFTIVEEGFIGVKYQFGKIVSDDLTAGLNFKIPFIEEIRQVDVRQQIYEFNGDAYTKDTQTVNNLRLKVTYQYDSSKLSELVRNVGIVNVESKFLVPNVQKIAKNEIGKVNAEMLVQTRASVQAAIEAELSSVLLPQGIIVTAFAIENISFSSVFEDSIQQKVIAEQDALRMKNKTEERREEAEQVKIKAEAEAEAIKFEAAGQAEAIKLIQEQLAASPQYVEYLKIQNWNGILPQVIGEGVNPFVVLDGGSNTMGTSRNNNTNND